MQKLYIILLSIILIIIIVVISLLMSKSENTDNVTACPTCLTKSQYFQNYSNVKFFDKIDLNNIIQTQLIKIDNQYSKRLKNITLIFDPITEPREFTLWGIYTNKQQFIDITVNNVNNFKINSLQNYMSVNVDIPLDYDSDGTEIWMKRPINRNTPNDLFSTPVSFNNVFMFLLYDN